MVFIDFLLKLRQILTEEDCRIVVLAIRQDPLIWKSFQDAQFAQKALDFAGNKTKYWNPAALSLLSVTPECTIDGVNIILAGPLSPELRSQAFKQYEKSLVSGSQPTSLDEAGLLALALKERRRLRSSWQGLCEELSLKPVDSPTPLFQRWSTALACTYHFIYDQLDFLQALLPTRLSIDACDFIKLCIHTVLCSPAPVVGHVEVFASLLDHSCLEIQLQFLSQLYAWGRSDLASQLAQSLLETKILKSLSRDLLSKPEPNSSQISSMPASMDPLARREDPRNAEKLQQLSTLYRFAGNYDLAQESLSQAHKAVVRLEARLLSQIASLADVTKNPEFAQQTWNKVVNLVPDSPIAQAKFASSLLSTSQPIEAVFQNSSFALGDNQNKLLEIETGLQSAKNPLLIDCLPEPEEVVRALIDHEMAPEAIAFTEKIINNRFADHHLLKLTTRAYLAANRPQDGLETSLTAVLINPNDFELHRLLAEVFEASDDFEKSFNERQFILDQVVPPLIDDRLAYASIALKVKKPEIAISAAQACLLEKPDCGLAFALAGEALLQKHELPAAIDQFMQATSLIPEQPGPWLALSSSLASAGDHQKSLEVLRSAAHAVPQSAEILFALGEQNLNSGYPSEALPPLREAFSIDKKSLSIALRLGETLFKLGHFDEANRVLLLSRTHNPANPDLAFLNGQVFLALGQRKQALQALLESVRTSKPAVAPCILLGETVRSMFIEEREDRTCFDGKVESVVPPVSTDNLQTVIAALENAAQSEPTNCALNLLLAEMYALSEFDQEAYNTFVKLSELSQPDETTWRSRFHFGLGKVSLKLGFVETAVASLREANSIDPENIEIRRVLTQAFQVANLADEALETAKSTLELAPDNLKILTWFTKTALSLNNTPEAIRAMDHALQIAPDRTDLVLRLGQIYVQMGDLVAGRQYLSRLTTIPNVQSTEYRTSASLLYQIEDFSAASACLEMAVAADQTPSWELFYELALTNEKNRNYLAALDNIQKAIANQPDDLKLCVLQADILTRLDRNLAALACLEHSLQIGHNQPHSEANPTNAAINEPFLINLENKNEKGISLSSIHTRISTLHRIVGDLRPALLHAQQALDFEPNDLEVRALATELAYGLLEDELALQLSTSAALNQDAFAQNAQLNSAQLSAIATILAVQANLNLEIGNLEIAGQAVARALAFASDFPQHLALQSRLNLRKSDNEAAARDLSQAYISYGIHFKKDRTNTMSLEGDFPRDLKGLWTLLSLAESALELHQWQASLVLFQQAALLEPQQPRPHLLYARALVIMTEMQETCKVLKIASHAPGEHILSVDFNKRFEEEIMLSNRLCNHPEINHWKSRGQVAFQPCHETISTLAKEASGTGDIAALVAGYRKIGDLIEARKAAEMAAGDPDVMFQLALALREESSEESIEIIRRLIEKDSTNPVYIAMLALLVREDESEALKLIENALGFWPEEFEWHKFAAELCGKLEDKVTAIFHWTRIVELKPGDLPSMLSLGSSYLENNNLDQAIQVFEHATRQNPEQSIVWKLLAKAQQKAGYYLEANNSIDRAILLEPDDLESILISGQTSLHLNQFDQTIQRAKSILASHPLDPDALLLYAQVMKQSGQPAEALKLIDQALPVLNNPFQLSLERAYLLKQTQGSQDVLPYILELAKTNPDEFDLLALLANTFSEVGQMDYAERTAQTALQLEPDNTAMHLLLGHVQRTKGQLDQSVHHLNEVIRQKPLQIEAYLELGRTYQERREHLQALKIYRQAMQVAPDDFRPFYQAGLALRESKDYLGAETMFRRAAHLAPDDLNIRRQLGAIITLNLVHHTQEVTISHEQ